MRKIVISGILFISFLVLVLNTAIAKDIARLKAINILENKNNIELNLTSTANIPYNVVYYMNGDIGVKLVNTALDSSLDESKHINVAKQLDISGVNINQDEPYSLEILISGNDNIKNKEIKVNNDVRKSNFILIEPVKEDDTISILPFVNDMPELPNVDTISFDETYAEKPVKQDAEKLTINEPISMLSQETVMKGKRLLAQAQPYNDDTSILDLGDEDFDKPLSTTTTDATTDENTGEDTSATEPSMTSSTSSSEVPPDQTVDALDVDNTTPEPEVTDVKKQGIFSTIFTFIKEKWLWLVGGGVCIIGLIVAVVVIGFAFSNSRSPESVTDEGEDYQEMSQQQQHQESTPIIDNEPVTYIPPSQIPTSQSVGDAISQIISIRNRSGK